MQKGRAEQRGTETERKKGQRGKPKRVKGREKKIKQDRRERRKKTNINGEQQ